MDVTRENNSAAVVVAAAPGGSSAEESCRDKCKSRHCHRYKHHRNTFLAVVIFNLFHLALANPVFVNNPSLAQFQSGRNIRHLPCIVRKSGLSGVCMFAIDCIKSNGTHLGTCIDRFYFGSCCQMKDESLYLAQEISDNSIDQNTISHFPHEATTVPTSALFKLTTQSYIGSSAHTSQELSSSTERLTNNVPYIPISTIIPPPQRLEFSTIKINSSTLDTTIKPSVTPTVTKLSSTSSSSVLTTTSSMKRTTVRTTTESPKFTTFQVVERDETTTFKPVRRPQTTYPTKSSIKTTISTRNPPKPTKTKLAQTTTKRPPVRITTTKQRPNTTRRTTSKRPNTTKRPISSTPSKTKPFRKPTTPGALLTSNSKRNATIITTTKPVKPLLSSSTTPVKPLYNSGTKAPRPRPKPTSQIVKVPPTTIKNDAEEKQDSTMYQTVFETTTPKTVSTTTIKTTTKAVEKIKITTTPIPATTTTTEKLTTKISTVPTTTTTKATIPTTTTTTEIPTTMSSTFLVTKLPSSTTSSFYTSTTTTTTSRPSSSEDSLGVPVVESTTQKPGLVTWTNLDDLKGNSTTQSNDINEDWQPRPPPSDWIPVPTIKPDNEQNKNDISSTFTSTGTDESTTEGNIKVSSSEPSTMGFEPSKEPSTTTTTTTKTTTTKATTTTTSTEAPSINTTTPLTIPTTPWNEITPLSTSTEKSSSIMPSVTDSSVDDNTTLMSSTQVPSLEGIDYRQICGKRMFPEPRIVGGANAAFGRWPWQISLRQWRTSTYLHKCGAALLNENWAITAAHCVDNVPPSDLLLRLGEYDLAEEEEPYGYQERRVQIVASHPQFDPRTFEYDLALLRFYEPVVFQPNIIPVCVPESDADFIGQTAYVTGWGRLYEDGPLPSVLQEVSVPVINNTICETMYRAAGYIEHIPHIFICAGWKKGGYDSCEGDSGGPMVLQRDDKRFLLAGIISWGIGCAEPNQPGVYTRISEFRDWINQILQF